MSTERDNRALLAVKGVVMRFGDGMLALDGLDIEVAEGEFLVVVGASGCGKTTLLNLFAGFLQPTSGQVLLGGSEIKGVEPRCGMVFQNYALFPWLTVAGNIGFGLKLAGVAGPEREAQVAELIQLMGIGGFERKYPPQLSGGMQQRVALARTLAIDPDVLLCDEPFAALDAMTRQVMQEELARLVHRQRKTCVFITHSIDEALLLGDRIAVMSSRPGRIKTLLVNDLPRPRNAALQLTARYGELKGEIWEQVQEEVLASMKG